MGGMKGKREVCEQESLSTWSSNALFVCRLVGLAVLHRVVRQAAICFSF